MEAVTKSPGGADGWQTLLVVCFVIVAVVAYLAVGNPFNDMREHYNYRKYPIYLLTALAAGQMLQIIWSAASSIRTAFPTSVAAFTRVPTSWQQRLSSQQQYFVIGLVLAFFAILPYAAVGKAPRLWQFGD